MAPWTSKHPAVQAGNEERGDPGATYPPAEMLWDIIPKNVRNEHDQKDPGHIGKNYEPENHFPAAKVTPTVRECGTALKPADKHLSSPRAADDLSSDEREQATPTQSRCDRYRIQLTTALHRIDKLPDMILTCSFAAQ
jgi:hypothetical protein